MNKEQLKQHPCFVQPYIFFQLLHTTKKRLKKVLI